MITPWRWCLFGAFAALCSTGAWSLDTAVTRAYFGFHAHRIATTTAWPSVPFGSWRLWDAYVAWPNLEHRRGQWDFEFLDTYVALAQRHDVELLLPLGLAPTWASARPEESSAYGRPGWAAEPARIGDWRNYVRTVASRYRGRIRHYEIWNEPNLPRFFSGSTAAMVELTCEAFSVIKALDPGAVVVSPSATDKARGVAWLRKFMATGGAACVDVVGFHFYTYAHEAPETMVPYIKEVRAIATEFGKPAVWNTETGWYFANRRVPAKTPYRVQDEWGAAAYIVRAFVIGASLGLERFFWYAWDNAAMGGLIEPDNAEVKPAVGALRSVLRWLIGARIGACGPSSGKLWMCSLQDERRGRASIVWNPGGKIDWTVPAGSAFSSYERLDGRSGSAASGARIEVGPLPVLLKSADARW